MKKDIDIPALRSALTENLTVRTAIWQGLSDRGSPHGLLSVFRQVQINRPQRLDLMRAASPSQAASTSMYDISTTNGRAEWMSHGFHDLPAKAISATRFRLEFPDDVLALDLNKPERRAAFLRGLAVGDANHANTTGNLKLIFASKAAAGPRERVEAIDAKNTPQLVESSRKVFDIIGANYMGEIFEAHASLASKTLQGFEYFTPLNPVHWRKGAQFGAPVQRAGRVTIAPKSKRGKRPAPGSDQ
jgi:hypothetical protein